jgi:hypothetical protein
MDTSVPAIAHVTGITDLHYLKCSGSVSSKAFATALYARVERVGGLRFTGQPLPLLVASR